MTTLGRGGSDLTATTIGKALGLREIQVNHCQFLFIFGILLCCFTSALSITLKSDSPLCIFCRTLNKLFLEL